MILAIAAAILTVVELCTFKSVSYRNYGQAVSDQSCRSILISKSFFSGILKTLEGKVNFLLFLRKLFDLVVSS
jgi:hypothetical protein